MRPISSAATRPSAERASACGSRRACRRSSSCSMWIEPPGGSRIMPRRDPPAPHLRAAPRALARAHRVGLHRGRRGSERRADRALAQRRGVVSEDTGETEFLPGRFIYQFNSITAQATFEGNVATMNIRNGTGADLGAPSLYVVGADDRRYDGMVEGAAADRRWRAGDPRVHVPRPVTPQTIGLVILSFGDDNVGRDGSGAETERLNPARPSRDRLGPDPARKDVPPMPRPIRVALVVCARAERARVPRRPGRRRQPASTPSSGPA